MRKIRFPDKGSIWCSRSGATVFPEEVEKITTKSADPPLTVLTARRGSSPFLLFSELALQKRVLDALQATRQEGIFSSLKQSDMCMVCIAFASWVLKSSDPESADAWKAALLANVSALSAIQYLRQYVKRRNPS
ncbi:PGC-1 and ERR-induced regulator in muscle protein 1 [Dissostichus eleginoides]|uniref:PGC-1 and ERR-induced regulator in muscle protein 1 n=1 Tax=Dissostichus eleginoides TaxID=100907 RepID=A0AAD9CJJ9_DISEL|nr:PGC-1 and ERR-induced regulator in muscle protein 1 [Dissostichus eleginoides]